MIQRYTNQEYWFTSMVSIQKYTIHEYRLASLPEDQEDKANEMARQIHEKIFNRWKFARFVKVSYTLEEGNIGKWQVRVLAATRGWEKLFPPLIDDFEKKHLEVNSSNLNECSLTFRCRELLTLSRQRNVKLQISA